MGGWKNPSAKFLGILEAVDIFPEVSNFCGCHTDWQGVFRVQRSKHGCKNRSKYGIQKCSNFLKTIPGLAQLSTPPKVNPECMWL